MAGVVFQDDFEVAQINPEGAKFEKVNRLVCKGVVYEIEFLIDVNSELFECEEGDKQIAESTEHPLRLRLITEEWFRKAEGDRQDQSQVSEV